MDDQQPGQPSAATRLGIAEILRELLDLNTIFDSDRPGRFRWWLIRLAFFALGSGAGWVLWWIIDAESASDRSWWESMLTNVYFWAALIATSVYALRDRRG
jgi:hypothetical protein